MDSQQEFAREIDDLFGSIGQDPKPLLPKGFSGTRLNKITSDTKTRRSSQSKKTEHLNHSKADILHFIDLGWFKICTEAPMLNVQMQETCFEQHKYHDPQPEEEEETESEQEEESEAGASDDSAS